MQYDKKRITSTVILFLFLGLVLFVTIPFLPLSWTALKESAEESGQGWAAVFGALAIVICFIFYIGALVASGICLPFAIANRKSTLKPVRILSYVLDGAFGAVILMIIIKMILLLLGV